MSSKVPFQLRPQERLSVPLLRLFSVSSIVTQNRFAGRNQFAISSIDDCLLFVSPLRSYCVKHRPPLDKLYSTVDPELTCNICFDRLQSNDSETSTSQLRYQILLTSCCQKFLHISCVKAQAYNAGIHHIKCPLCNDRDSFINCAQEHGVYIPGN